MPRAPRDLDVRILRELTSPGSFQWDFRESYSAIARKLGADSETVRVTLRRAMEMGLVKKWRLVINPELFGWKLAAMQLEVDEAGRKQQVLHEVQLVDGVVQIMDFHGPGIRLIAYFEDEFALERKVELIKSICRCVGDAPVWVSQLPHCKMKMRDADWTILKCVMHDPRRDATEVSREVGLSRRTVSRRLKLMTMSYVAYLIPVRDVKKSRGTLCSFLILCSERGKERVRGFLRSQPIRVDFTLDVAKGVFILTVVADNPTEANELQSELRALEGVIEVKLGLLNDIVFVDDWIDQMVSRRTPSKSGTLPQGNLKSLGAKQ